MRDKKPKRLSGLSQILVALYNNPGGLTSPQIHQRMLKRGHHMAYGSVSASVSELAKAKLVRKLKSLPCAMCGCARQRYSLTSLGKQRYTEENMR